MKTFTDLYSYYSSIKISLTTEACKYSTIHQPLVLSETMSTPNRFVGNRGYSLIETNTNFQGDV